MTRGFKKIFLVTLRNGAKKKPISTARICCASAGARAAVRPHSQSRAQCQAGRKSSYRGKPAQAGPQADPRIFLTWRWPRAAASSQRCSRSRGLPLFAGRWRAAGLLRILAGRLEPPSVGAFPNGFFGPTAIGVAAMNRRPVRSSKDAGGQGMGSRDLQSSFPGIRASSMKHFQHGKCPDRRQGRVAQACLQSDAKRTAKSLIERRQDATTFAAI